MPDEKDWAVVLTDTAVAELGEELKQHMTEGPTGSYILCKEVDMNRPYLRMIVEFPLSDGSPFEIEIYVPHHYVKLIIAGNEEKLKKVVGHYL